MIKHSIRGEKRKEGYLHQVSSFDNTGKDWVVHDYFNVEHITEEQLKYLKDTLSKRIEIENNRELW